MASSSDISISFQVSIYLTCKRRLDKNIFAPKKHLKAWMLLLMTDFDVQDTKSI